MAGREGEREGRKKQQQLQLGRHRSLCPGMRRRKGGRTGGKKRGRTGGRKGRRKRWGVTGRKGRDA